MMLLSIWAGISKGLSRDITEVSIIFAVVAGMTGFLYVPVRSTNDEISSQRVAIGGHLFREALRKRIEYEKFYRSPEWQILRQTFLRARKQTGGRYICDFCRNPIWLHRDITVDHRKPRWKFPELAMNMENLLLACRRCNSSKGGKLLSDEEFNLLLAANRP